ncbi:uncharacterized protein LOC125648189 isoform X2 [Ostrea edulis]|nr:uncharacterized protein LOC125648189 isoform X2 [Ostrea edulis]XP_048731107.2 uncharacterized protein LOC125648189 isoform X2 [Ostrea edulis]XP_048731108.2 uncharacterized protein LOC125648189 isoform X2 [Ostrea edulis]XP_048731109.2 uncharacterized protein LOC125648189 isoform X2 [Ostrea edulis]
MADLLKPTESSRMKERTLTDSKIALKKEKSSMSVDSNKTGNDLNNLKNGNILIESDIPKDNVKTDDQINRDSIEKDKIPVHNNSALGDVLQQALSFEENDLDEYDPDLFITEEEKKAFEYMLEQKRAEIVQRKEDFEKWVDTITRRRMFALSRMRKINISNGKRNKLYGKLEKFITDVYSENGDNSRGSTPGDENGNVSKQSTNIKTGSVVQNNVEMDGQRASLLSREDTGFVSRDNDPSMKPVQEQTPLVAPLHS